MKYGLNLENQALIMDKAKTKRNGVYTFRGCAYRVIDGYVTHIMTHSETVQPAGAFNIRVGDGADYQEQRIKKLKALV